MNLTASTKILIIDDDRDDIDIFIDAISELDDTIHCISVNNAADALAILQNSLSEKPDYIFLDLNMPRISGQSFLQEIKNSSSLKDIPVIIYTTTKHIKEVDEVKNLGANYFLTKPTLFQDLQDALSCIIRHRTPDRELKDRILTEF